MATIDYSKNDFIDINNQLFRRARNNIGKSVPSIKDSEDKSGDTEKLGIYGSELINNLNQINYTFEQIETYIFVPSKITKKNIAKVIEAGVKAKVEDIKAPTPEIEVLPEEDLSLPELGGPDYIDYIFIDRGLDLSLKEYEDAKALIEAELIKMDALIIKTAEEQGIDISTDEGLALADSKLSSMIQYHTRLQDELFYINGAIKEEEETPPSSGFVPVEFPEAGADLITIRQMIKAKAPISVLKEELIRIGFKGVNIQSLESVKQVRTILKNYEAEIASLPTEGAGRYRGGAGVKGMKKGVKTPKTSKAKTLKTKDPIVGETEEEFEDIEDDAVADEVKENFSDTKTLDKSLVKVVNTGQKSPVPSYLSKVYELMMNLVQFIGRTTVLYITRIKKNLNYLDEEQVKLIFDANNKLPRNIAVLRDFENKGGALIKDTLYKQIKKETQGLYDEINNSIKNYAKLKDYTTFSGAGLRGGYFIQSDDPFIRSSTTKRFL